MTKKIAIIGTESTGKTTLTQQLSTYYQATFVLEYAREYLSKITGTYQKSDLLEIAKGQIRLENEKKDEKLLFCDTNLIVIKIWSDHKYGHTDSWITSTLKKSFYDFHLLMDIDLPWKKDPLREHPHLRQYLFDKYKHFLEYHKLPYAIVHEKGKKRLKNAISILNPILQ